MLESEFYNRIVQKKMNGWGVMRRVESTVASGLPDLQCAFFGWRGGIELKVAKKGLLYFQKYQLPNMNHFLRHGGRYSTLVLAYNPDCKETLVISDDGIIGQRFQIKGRWTCVNLETTVPLYTFAEDASWDRLKQWFQRQGQK